MIISLAGEIALLAYHDDGIARGSGGMLDYGVGGAVLLELALAERVTVRDKNVVVLDPTPTGQEVLDEALRRIAGASRPRRPKAWVYRLGRHARPQVLDTLVASGVLQRERDRFLLVVPYTRYPAPGGVEPQPETDVRRRMRAAVTTTGPVDPRTAAMCALIGALGWQKQVFGDLPGEQVKARLTEIRESAWAAEAVRKAIVDLQVVVLAGI
ncbi:MAG TPA: GPP34 family phosphoprotein [Actinoplanes sp.]|nr:GPP34 family phosphoprotein [Actinoplanes sp.]